MQVLGLDAPIEGWDAFNSIDNMPPTAAVVLNNLIPGAGTVETRLGHIIYEELPGVTGVVQTLASYDAADQSELLAAADGGIWRLDDSVVEVSAQAVLELAPIGTYQNDKWQTENFQKGDEQGVLVMCNGVDLVQIYNGTTLVDINITGTDPGLSLTPDFIGNVAFKGRMYYWKDKDNAFYYSQAGSYQGELQKFDLGTFVQQGGYLVLAFTWTQQDAGHGRDDFMVFVFSTGEILVYQGDDPQTAGYWEQVGRYLAAEPLDIRGYTNYGADAILMTRDGYVSMASIMKEGRTSDVPGFSRLIHRAVIERTQNTLQLFGWDVELFQKQGLLIFNVPLSDETFEQHVMNTVTQKWCRFKGLNVNCLEVHNERLFGGAADGKVFALLETTSDAGEAITFDALYAFNTFGDNGNQKGVLAAQVFTTHSAPQDILISAWADYEIPGLTPINQPTARVPSAWSVNPDGYPGPPALPLPPSEVGSFWDEDYWSSEGVAATTKGWQNVAALGFSVALLVRFSKLNESVTWRSTQIRYHTMGAE